MRQRSEKYAPNVNRIYSLTEFQRKAKDFLKLLQGTRIPLVLTVNGKASVVIQDAPTYQEMVDRLKRDDEFFERLLNRRNEPERIQLILDEVAAEMGDQ